MKKILLAVIVSLFLAGSTNAAEFNTNLKFGSKGADVVKLQEFLAEQNLYSGPITGNFFSLTLKAVKALQTREAISPVSGFFGNLTRAKVNAILDNQLVDSEAEAVVEPVDTGSPVSAEVLRLNEILGAVQAQNTLLQNSLNLQQSEIDRRRAVDVAEATRLKGIADAADVAAVARQQAEQAARDLAAQQAAVAAAAPLYSQEQMRAKFSNLLTVSTVPCFGCNTDDPMLNQTNINIFYSSSAIVFSRNGSLSDWGNARVVFNGQTILDKNHGYCEPNCAAFRSMVMVDGQPTMVPYPIGNTSPEKSVGINGLLPGQTYSYQIIIPGENGRSDSVFEGQFTTLASHLNRSYSVNPL